MSALSDAERIRLARLNEAASTIPWNPKKGGRALADDLRRALPDLDDVSVGRVLLEIGGFIGRLADGRADGTLHVLTDQVMCAALDLTAVEWQEAPDTTTGDPS